MCSVVLGGDSPLGAPLIAGLEKEGYIVITSVSDPDAVAEIEANGNGFVRALVFEPNEVFPSYVRSETTVLISCSHLAFYFTAVPPVFESDS